LYPFLYTIAQFNRYLVLGTLFLHITSAYFAAHTHTYTHTQTRANTHLNQLPALCVLSLQEHICTSNTVLPHGTLIRQTYTHTANTNLQYTDSAHAHTHTHTHAHPPSHQGM